MSNQGKIRLTAAVAVAIIGALGIYSWQLRQELAVAQGSTASESSEPLREKLEALADRQSATDNFPSLFDPGMNFNGFNPSQQLQQMQQRMDELFNSMTAPGGSLGSGLGGFGLGGFGPAGSSSWQLQQPNIDLQESDKDYRITLSIADGSEIELETELEDQTLSISAEVRSEIRNNSGNMQSSSSSVSQFSRSIFLDEAVDATGLKTEKGADEIVITIPKLG